MEYDQQKSWCYLVLIRANKSPPQKTNSQNNCWKFFLVFAITLRALISQIFFKRRYISSLYILSLKLSIEKRDCRMVTSGLRQTSIAFLMDDIIRVSILGPQLHQPRHVPNPFGEILKRNIRTLFHHPNVSPTQPNLDHHMLAHLLSVVGHIESQQLHLVRQFCQE